MTDLDRLRVWARAEPGRALVLRGVDGTRGVQLIAFRNARRNICEFDSVASACVAASAELIAWVTCEPVAEVSCWNPAKREARRADQAVRSKEAAARRKAQKAAAVPIA